MSLISDRNKIKDHVSSVKDGSSFGRWKKKAEEERIGKKRTHWYVLIALLFLLYLNSIIYSLSLSVSLSFPIFPFDLNWCNFSLPAFFFYCTSVQFFALLPYPLSYSPLPFLMVFSLLSNTFPTLHLSLLLLFFPYMVPSFPCYSLFPLFSSSVSTEEVCILLKHWLMNHWCWCWGFSGSGAAGCK